jgi:hypothetical protein
MNGGRLPLPGDDNALAPAALEIADQRLDPPRIFADPRNRRSRKPRFSIRGAAWRAGVRGSGPEPLRQEEREDSYDSPLFAFVKLSGKIITSL